MGRTNEKPHHLLGARRLLCRAGLHCLLRMGGVAMTIAQSLATYSADRARIDARGRERKLTAGDAIHLGFALQSFRDMASGLDAQHLRKFGFLRLWHAENHRKRWGADYRPRFEEILQEARESFRLAKMKGCILP